MSDQIVGLAEDELLIRDPDFIDLQSGIFLDSAAIKGASTRTNVDSLTKAVAWTGAYQWQSHTHQEKYELFSFWLSRMGRVRSFYMPTWTADFKQARRVNAGDSFIHVEGNGFEHLYNNHSDRASAYTNPAADLTTRWGLMIIDQEDNKWFRLIDYPDGLLLNTPTLGEYRLVFATETGKDETLPPMKNDTIRCISLIPRVRANSENCNFQFLTDGVSLFSLTVREIYYESPAPV